LHFKNIKIMNTFYKVFFLIVFNSLTIVSCKKDDDDDSFIPPPPRPYAEQTPEDIAAIDKYLDENSMVVDGNFDVTFDKAKDPSESIRKKFASSLKEGKVSYRGYEFPYYYIVLREGAGEKPVKVDSIFVNYSGKLLDNTVFDERLLEPVWFYSPFINPENGQYIERVTEGFLQVLTKFKTGIIKPNTTSGEATVEDFGAGVMFLPSGLGYYNNPPLNSKVTSYVPLIFNFKLKSINRADFDGDYVDSIHEDINGDGDFFNDDTDGDRIPDFLDREDDGDGFLTKFEIRVDGNLPKTFQEIKDCSGNTTGKKKYVDASCK
jgi:FKBP-type peptidyl-prolyl cis-trans isomerase FkpA